MEKVIRVYLSLFLILPESAFTFISGVLLSAAINIATSQLPSSIWVMLRCNTIISMFLMFAACIIFMWLGVSVKPHQEAHSRLCSTEEIDPRTQDWVSYLKGKNVIKKWSILFFLSISTTIASLIFLVY